MKKVISHNVIPPTVLEITEWGYKLSFGFNKIPLGKDEAKKLADIILQDLNITKNEQ